MQRVTRELACEVELHEWVMDASDLGWAVGRWPKEVATDLGNGMPFMLQELKGDHAMYRQANGCLTLKVWND